MLLLLLSQVKDTVLLSTETVTNYSSGTALSIWEIGGNHRTVEPPIKPFFHSLKPNGSSIAETKILLSDLKQHRVYRVECSDENRLKQLKNAWTINDYFPFKTVVAMTCGFHILNKDIKILAYDLETYTGLSPDYRVDKIRSIATYNGSEAQFFCCSNEADTIREFIKYVKQENPDVLMDFFGRFYDMQVLTVRCGELRIPLELGRNNGVPYLLRREFEKNGKGRSEHTFLINGRVHFDVQKETDADYTLTLAGLKNRGLKNVAKHYGFNPVEVDYETMSELSFDKLKEYNVSDAVVTYKVGLSYFNVAYALAELLDLPLDMVVNRTPSTIPNIVLGRELEKIGVISDGANKDRFPQFFAPGKKAVQGAEPKGFASGVYTENVKHKDFSSMYVSVMRALNLSPETVSLVHIRPYTGHYNFRVYSGYCIAELPDEINGQVTVRIDLSKKGVMRQFLDDIVYKRGVAKQNMKNAKSESQRNFYNSQQIALKLIGNVMFGYHSMPYAAYGNVLIALCCTAIPRLLINSSMQMEREAGNTILEVDTDGYWYLEEKAIEFKAESVLPNCFDVSLITQGKEDINGIILLEDVNGDFAAKSYILKEHDGKITKHGSSVLGRHIPLIVDYFIDELTVCLFNREEPIQVLKRWNNKKICGYPTNSFVQTVTLSKRPESYDSTSMFAGLIKQLVNAGLQVDWGTKINYVACKSGYVPTAVLKETDCVDASYYQEKMASVASRIVGLPEKTVLSYMKGDSLLDSYI